MTTAVELRSCISCATDFLFCERSNSFGRTGQTKIRHYTKRKYPLSDACLATRCGKVALACPFLSCIIAKIPASLPLQQLACRRLARSRKRSFPTSTLLFPHHFHFVGDQSRAAMMPPCRCVSYYHVPLFMLPQEATWPISTRCDTAASQRHQCASR